VEDDPLTKLRTAVLEFVVERWPIAFGHAQVTQDQIIGPGLELFERETPMSCRVHLVAPPPEQIR